MKHKQFCIKAIFFWAFTLFISSGAIFAQDVIFEEYVVPDRYGSYGANMQHFVHFYYNSALPVATNTEEITTGDCTFIHLGLRYKLKLNATFAIGTDIELGTFNYSLNPAKYVLPSKITGSVKTWGIVALDASSGLFLRTNIGKRGNTIGDFIDIYAHLNRALTASERIKYEYLSDDGVNRNELIRNAGLPYFNSTIAVLGIRIGLNRVVATAAYRSSNYFSDSSKIILPKWTFGLQVGIHK